MNCKDCKAWHPHPFQGLVRFGTCRRKAPQPKVFWADADMDLDNDHSMVQWPDIDGETPACCEALVMEKP